MKKETITILITVVILFSTNITAELTPDNIYLSQTLTIQVNQSSQIIINPLPGPSSTDYVEAQITFLPQTDYRQKIEKIQTNPKAQIKEEILFTWINPKHRILNYTITTKLTTKNEFKQVKNKIPYPLKTLPTEVIDYLKNTEHIDSKNPQIITKAQELAQGEDDLYVLVNKIAIWIKNNIKYSLTTKTAEVSQSASWVLKNKEGACDELTALFIAILRTLNIPAKFVSGLAYSNSPLTPEEWGPHGWAEVYFPTIGWIPFDPTFGEFGWIDPTHIKMKESTDPVDPAIKFQWRGKNIDVQIPPLKFDVSTLQLGKQIEPTLKINTIIQKTKTGFGSWNLVEAEIQNLKDYYVPTEINLIKVKEFETKDQLTKQILLKPHEKQKLFWQIQTTKNLQPQFAYKIPLTTYTLRNETSKTNFIATSTAPQYTQQEINIFIKKTNTTQQDNTNINTTCTPEKEYYYSEDTVKINCKIQNTGVTSLEQLKICVEDQCENFTLKPQQTHTTNFYLNTQQIGSHEIFITTENAKNSQTTLTSYTIFDKPLIEITNLTTPKEIEYTQKKRIKFTLQKKSWSSPQKVNVHVEGARRMQDVAFDTVEGDIPFIFIIDGQNLNEGENKITTSISYEDNNGNIYYTKKETNINLVNVTTEQKFRILLQKTRELFRI